MAKLGTLGRSGFIRKTNDSMRLIMTTFVGFLIGFLIGISFPSVNITKLHFPSSIASYNEDKNSGIETQALLNHAWMSTHNNNSLLNSTSTTKIYVSTNPKGAERLPPEIIVPESDFYLRRLWGNPNEDLPFEQKYLVTFTVGYEQKKNIDAAVKKLSFMGISTRNLSTVLNFIGRISLNKLAELNSFKSGKSDVKFSLLLFYIHPMEMWSCNFDFLIVASMRFSDGL